MKNLTNKTTFSDIEPFITWDENIIHGYFNLDTFYNAFTKHLESKLNVMVTEEKIELVEKEMDDMEERLAKIKNEKVINSPEYLSQYDPPDRRMMEYYSIALQLQKQFYYYYLNDEKLSLSEFSDYITALAKMRLEDIIYNIENNIKPLEPVLPETNYKTPLDEAAFNILRDVISSSIGPVYSIFRYKDYLVKKLKVIKEGFKENKGRLLWKGTPAQLAFIINLFQTKGYIEGLTPFGERNAKILLDHFEIEGHSPTPESLGRCFQQLKNDELPINKEDAAQFQRIPNRNDLKK